MQDHPRGFVEVRDEQSAIVATIEHEQRANALSLDVLTELAAVLSRAASAGKVLVLTGAGSNFCSGIDVQEMDGPHREELMAACSDFIDRLHQMPVPVIGAINGPAVGGGVEVLMSCDLRVANSRASIRPRGIRWGSVSGMRLSQFFPIGLATEAIWLERRIDSEEAHRWGLFNRVVGADEVVPVALEIARSLSELPRSAIEASRSMLRHPPPSWSALLAAQHEASAPTSPSTFLKA